MSNQTMPWSAETAAKNLEDFFLNYCGSGKKDPEIIFWLEEALVDELPEYLDYANLLRMSISGNHEGAEKLSNTLLRRSCERMAKRHADKIQNEIGGWYE